MQKAPLHLSPRKSGALLGLLFSVAMTLSALFNLPAFVAWLSRGNSWLPVVATVLVIIVLGGAAIAACWKSLTMTGPAIVLDENGLTDRRKKQFAIRWDQMDSLVLDTSHGNRLLIRLRADALDDFGRSKLGSTLRRTFEGSDISLYLGSIRYERRELEARIAEYLSQAASARRAQAPAHRSP